jgi:hypothetical protein
MSVAPWRQLTHFLPGCSVEGFHRVGGTKTRQNCQLTYNMRKVTEVKFTEFFTLHHLHLSVAYTDHFCPDLEIFFQNVQIGLRIWISTE